ncbi:hypothetical protein V1478_009144 [Vespula squamosa]|uniref:Uncharacterized protein n=1 Tax=Vespula squamosa TaxID=30214 RepID=A0ABD2ANT3_VESSQ
MNEPERNYFEDQPKLLHVLNTQIDSTLIVRGIKSRNIEGNHFKSGRSIAAVWDIVRVQWLVKVAPRSWAPIYEGLEEPYLGHFVMSRGIFVGIIMAAIDTLRSYRKLYRIYVYPIYIGIA